MVQRRRVAVHDLVVSNRDTATLGPAWFVIRYLQVLFCNSAALSLARVHRHYLNDQILCTVRDASS